MYGPQIPAHYPSYGVSPESNYRHLDREARTRARLPWLLLVLVVVSSVYLGQLAWKDRQRLSALVDRGQQSESQLRELEIKLRGLEAERTDLLSARDSLQKNVEQKTSELTQLKGTYDSLQEKMKEEIARGEIAVSQSGDRLRVDMVDKILFESGRAQVSKRGEGVLARLGAVLAKMGDKQLQVSGHTDNQAISRKLRRQYPSNWELSIGRAMNVVRFLQQSVGVPPERLVASGYGEHHPIDSNRTRAGRARNRRIEILLTPMLAPQPLSASRLKDR